MISFELQDLPLVCVSPSDVSFDNRRNDADKVSFLMRSHGHDEWITPRSSSRPPSSAADLSARIGSCAQSLVFKQSPTGLKLQSAKFCRVRCCPICQWRRSLVWQSRALSIMPLILKDYPDANFLFLTLTVRNCSIFNLRRTLNRMQSGWEKLMGLKGYKPRITWLGYIKSFEVTMADKSTAHPHYHALLMMPPDYYSEGFISHKELIAMWRDCCGLDYLPSCRIMAVHEPQTKVCEVIKYCVKPSDLVRSRSWLIEYNRQVYGFRAIEKAGLFRTYFKDLDENPDNLININEDKSKCLSDEGYPNLSFIFDARLRRYVLYTD